MTNFLILPEQTYHVRLDAGGFLGGDHGDACLVQQLADADHFESAAEAHEAADFFGLAGADYLVVPDELASTEEGA